MLETIVVVLFFIIHLSGAFAFRQAITKTNYDMQPLQVHQSHYYNIAKRTIAIGDVHGHYNVFLDLMIKNKLIRLKKHAGAKMSISQKVVDGLNEPALNI